MKKSRKSSQIVPEAKYDLRISNRTQNFYKTMLIYTRTALMANKISNAAYNKLPSSLLARIPCRVALMCKTIFLACVYV